MPPPVAVNVTVEPTQAVVLPVIVGTGRGVTVMVVDNTSTHVPFVMDTVYTVVEAGVTTMAAVVSPVLQRYVPPPVAVIVAEAPAQMIPSLLNDPEVSVTVIVLSGPVNSSAPISGVTASLV